MPRTRDVIRRGPGEFRRHTPYLPFKAVAFRLIDAVLCVPLSRRAGIAARQRPVAVCLYPDSGRSLRSRRTLRSKPLPLPFNPHSAFRNWLSPFPAAGGHSAFGIYHSAFGPTSTRSPGAPGSRLASGPLPLAVTQSVAVLSVLSVPSACSAFKAVVIPPIVRTLTKFLPLSRFC